MILTLSSSVIQQKKEPPHKHTNWDKFRENLNQMINLKLSLKSAEEVNKQAQYLTEAICKVAKNLTSTSNNIMVQET